MSIIGADGNRRIQQAFGEHLLLASTLLRGAIPPIATHIDKRRQHVRATDRHLGAVDPDAQLFLHPMPKGVLYKRNSNSTADRNGFPDLLLRLRQMLEDSGCDLARPRKGSFFFTNYLAVVECGSESGADMEEHPLDNFPGTIAWQTLGMTEAALPDHLKRFLKENRTPDHISPQPQFKGMRETTLVGVFGTLPFLAATVRVLLDPERIHFRDRESLLYAITKLETDAWDFRRGIADRIGINVRKGKKESDARASLAYFVDNVRTHIDARPKLRGAAIASRLGLAKPPVELALQSRF